MVTGGQVTHVKIEEARESPKIVMGTLRVIQCQLLLSLIQEHCMLLCPNNLHSHMSYTWKIYPLL